tara:strand:+ start:394 stop:588 length:195 start_codon:yes stop_codon:yes gene_type:complete
MPALLLMKISQIKELVDDDFCPIHGYLCHTQLGCWYNFIQDGNVIFCDESEDEPSLCEPDEVAE